MNIAKTGKKAFRGCRILKIEKALKAKEGPYRLSAKDAEGKPVLVITRNDCGLRPGMRAPLTGMALPKPDRDHGFAFIMEDPAPPLARMRAILHGEADVISFGMDFDLAERPVTALWMGMDLDHIFEAVPVDGVTRMKPASDSEDPNIRWMTDLIAEIETGNHLFAFLDPIAFLPVPAKEPTAGPGGADDEMEHIAPLYAEIRLTQAASRLRQLTPDMAAVSNPDISREQVDLAGSALNWNRRHRRGQRKIGHPITMIGRYESWTTRAQDWSGLSSISFAVKTDISPEQRNALMLAASFASALAEEYGFKDETSLAGRAARAAFADSFAILACARRYGDSPLIEQFAAMRQAQIIIGNLALASGRAASAALEMARDMLKSGTMGSRTAEELLEAAAKITRTERLRDSELSSLIEQRNKIYQFCDIQTDEEIVRDSSGGATAYEAIKRAIDLDILLDSAAAEMMGLAVKGVESHFETPMELNRESSRSAAVKRYGEDLDMTLNAIFGGSSEAETHALLLDHERMMHLEDRGITDFMMRVMPFLQAEASLSGARISYIDRRMARITLPTEYRKPKPLKGKAAGRFFAARDIAIYEELAASPPRKRAHDFEPAIKDAISKVEDAMRDPKRRIAYLGALEAVQNMERLAFSLVADAAQDGTIAGVAKKQTDSIRHAASSLNAPLPPIDLDRMRKKLYDLLSEATGSQKKMPEIKPAKTDS